jgi:hypothetical protein
MPTRVNDFLENPYLDDPDVVVRFPKRQPNGAGDVLSLVRFAHCGSRGHEARSRFRDRRLGL